jgi:hypothetical protein
VRRNGSRLRGLTDPEPIDPVLFDPDPDYRPDGRRIVFQRSGHDREIRVMRADGSREHPIPDTDQAGSPVYAPAGDRLALAIGTGSVPGGRQCVGLQLVAPGGENVDPQWSQPEAPGLTIEQAGEDAR